MAIHRFLLFLMSSVIFEVLVISLRKDLRRNLRGLVWSDVMRLVLRCSLNKLGLKFNEAEGGCEGEGWNSNIIMNISMQLCRVVLMKN